MFGRKRRIEIISRWIDELTVPVENFATLPDVLSSPGRSEACKAIWKLRSVQMVVELSDEDVEPKIGGQEDKRG
ncbi:hypothetical protein WN55_04373 [Dufourea novaeangliae]|uniref:Uncharacterized protein n=1 Tax=Dufourea novaeangliae TaxID=178035 RepID=A0A154PLW2_DUFNO|nr:hypothetical protein WN55_04373 [Dufourea novaeangliae]